MKITQKLAIALVVIGLVLGGPAYAAQNWKLGHTFPGDTLEDQAIQDFAKRVEELSKGEIKIRVFPAMQLGDWTVMQQRVSMGGLEMATQPASSQAEKRISFVNRNHGHFKNAKAPFSGASLSSGKLLQQTQLTLNLRR